MQSRINVINFCCMLSCLSLESDYYINKAVSNYSLAIYVQEVTYVAS